MLCDAKELKRRGYSAWFIKGVKRAGAVFGDNPFIGRYVYEEDLRAWIHRHPEFVASQTLRSKLPRPPLHNPGKAPSAMGLVDRPVNPIKCAISPIFEDQNPPATPRSTAYGLPRAVKKRPSRTKPVAAPSPEWESCRSTIIRRRSNKTLSTSNE
jgi:hypothetical protein